VNLPSTNGRAPVERRHVAATPVLTDRRIDPVADAAVVICAYTERRWDDITRAISSALDQTPGPSRVILVVDHDDALYRRAFQAFPEVEVVQNERARGLSGARNTAIQLCSEDVVVFLDDDASAEPGWLEALTAPYADERVQAVGGVAEPVWPDGERPRMLAHELDWVVGCSYEGQAQGDVRNLIGCNMSFRRDVFERVGNFEESVGRIGTLPLGCEETELCIRVTRHDPAARIVLRPEARVRHRVSADRVHWKYLVRRCYAEGISKAAISRLVGASEATSSERTYATKVLPRGVARALRRGRPSQALGIVVGLGCTVAGYVRGAVQR